MLLCLAALPYAGQAQQAAQPSAQPTLPAAQMPSAPVPQPSSQPTPTPALPAFPGTISGTVIDIQGAVVVGARITLPRKEPNAPADASQRTAVSSSEGQFTLPNIPPGPFTLLIEAIGFMPQHASGVLRPGESFTLPAIALNVGTSTSVQITASQADIAEAQIGEEERQRVLGVFPNFYVSYIPNPAPLTARQKFELALKTLIDPVNFVLIGAVAGLEQDNNTYAWGEGAQGYAKRYAAAYGTFLDGTLIGSAALPILLKQDPRYFYKGTGSVRQRALYAIANAVVCKGDNHHWQFNYSAVLGGLAAGGLSNLYYPAANREDVSLAFEGSAIGTGITAVTNLLQEFVVHKITPHIPHLPPAAPSP